MRLTEPELKMLIEKAAQAPSCAHHGRDHLHICGECLRVFCYGEVHWWDLKSGEPNYDHAADCECEGDSW